MGTPPKLRPSYQSDARYFRRLAHAVEHDEVRSPEWRCEVLALIAGLVARFEQVVDGKETGPQTPPQSTET